MRKLIAQAHLDTQRRDVVRTRAVAAHEAREQKAEADQLLSDYRQGKPVTCADGLMIHGADVVAHAVESIALGLQGVIDETENEGGPMSYYLPHLDRIESAAAAAQYAIETNLPMRRRKRHIFDLAQLAAVFVVAWILIHLWQWLA